jgi:hypothetical protein
MLFAQSRSVELHWGHPAIRESIPSVFGVVFLFLAVGGSSLMLAGYKNNL